MNSKQKVLAIFPDARAVNHVENRHPKFPHSMIRSAPRRHFLRKKYARYLKGKWHYVVIMVTFNGKGKIISSSNTEAGAWMQAVKWYHVTNKITEQTNDK